MTKPSKPRARSASRPVARRRLPALAPKPRNPLTFLASGRLRAVLLLAVLTIATSSRGDVGAPAPDAVAPAISGIAWRANVAYDTGNVVSYGGALYQALAPNENEEPDTSPTFWAPFGAPAEAVGNLSQVTPVLDCIYPSPLSSYPPPPFTAVFGYMNSGSTTVIASISSTTGADENAFSPGPAGQGQPISFASGTHHAAFAVGPTEGPLTWTLGTNTVTATGATPVCSVTQGPDGPIATVNGSSILVQPRSDDHSERVGDRSPRPYPRYDPRDVPGVERRCGDVQHPSLDSACAHGHRAEPVAFVLEPGGPRVRRDGVEPDRLRNLPHYPVPKDDCRGRRRGSHPSSGTATPTASMAGGSCPPATPP